MKKVKEIDSFIKSEFVNSLKDIFSDNLFSVLVYGSYVKGNFVPGVSDINVLILLNKPDNNAILNFGKTLHKKIKKFIITPLIITKDEFLRSADVFPIEYFDIKSRHLLIYGEDIIEKLELKKTNLRHQIEDRLRGSLVSLRQVLVASKGKRYILKKYLLNWPGLYNALFRGLLILEDEKNIPDGSFELLERVKETYKIETKNFINLYNYKETKKGDPLGILNGLIFSIQEIIRLVDQKTISE